MSYRVCTTPSQTFIYVYATPPAHQSHNIASLMFLFAVKLQDYKDSAASLSHALSGHCSNSMLTGYNGSDLKEVEKYLRHEGCVWATNETASDSLVWRHKRAASSSSHTNPTAITLLKIVHAFHILSIAILAVMVLEVSSRPE